MVDKCILSKIPQRLQKFKAWKPLYEWLASLQNVRGTADKAVVKAWSPVMQGMDFTAQAHDHAASVYTAYMRRPEVVSDMICLWTGHCRDRGGVQWGSGTLPWLQPWKHGYPWTILGKPIS